VKYGDGLVKCITRQLHFPLFLGSGQPRFKPRRCILFSFHVFRNMEGWLVCVSHAAQHQHSFTYLRTVQHFRDLMRFMFRAGSVTQDTSFKT